MKTITKILLILTLGFGTVGASCVYETANGAKHLELYQSNGINAHLQIAIESLIRAKYDCPKDEKLQNLIQEKLEMLKGMK